MIDYWWLIIDYSLIINISAVFIKLRKFLIIDGVHTENTEGYGCPQADEVGEQQLSKIGQQLKEKNIYPQMTRRDTEDDYWWLMTDYWLSSHGKCGGHGGPQADGGGERKLKRINRELKEMGPQADEEGNKFRLMMKDSWLVMIDDWLLIVFTRKMRMMRRSAGGRGRGTQIKAN